MGWMRLAAGWASVAAFLALGPERLTDAPSMVGVALFLWLLGVVVWAAFGVVHEAEELADRLGEPFGTLILTLSIVIIEVALISAVMLGAKDAPTLGRDTMFAVLMIVLNGVVGLGLLLGGLRHHEQRYNLKGAPAFLAVLIPLTTISLILPNFTRSTSEGTLSNAQALLFSLFTFALYGCFLILQTGRHRGYFTEPEEALPQSATERAQEAADAAAAARRHAESSVWRTVALLLANILPIVILAKSLAVLLDRGLASTGAPPALGGILIAMVVLTPEGIAAMRAVTANQLQRTINLCLGAATSTVGLTVPAVLGIGLLTGQTVVLGLAATDMVLLATTLLLSALTFSGQRTTMLEGAVHLVLFFVFLVLVFSP